MNQSAVSTSLSALAIAVAFSACGSDEGDVILELTGPARSVACEEIVLSADVQNYSGALSWSVEGVPLLFVEGTNEEAVLRAPAYHTDYTLKVTASATDDSDAPVVATHSVEVAAAQTAEGDLPGNVAACGPFRYGVASGDPGPDSVYLWTRWHSDEPGAGELLTWEMATDPAMTDVVASGQDTVDGSSDFTTIVDVEGLDPGTTYFFRFRDSSGQYSELGRTRTLPDGEVDEFTFAVASCSSLFSGYFNAYARLAERDEVDLVIHLGDLVYDFADGEEEIRMPAAGVPDPSTLEGYRQRFVDYLLDPDQRRARQMHPWFAIWDNHDSDVAGGSGAEQAFREYVPMAPPNPSDPDGIFRSMQVGNLLDIMLVDALRERETTENGPDILGADQWLWLENQLLNSRARWHVYGTQKLVSELAVPDIIGSPTPWNDYTESRSRFYRLLNDYPNNLVLAGDFHTSVANNLYLDEDGEATKDEAGATAVGAEFLPTSVTRGNFDETICGGLCENDVQASLLDTVRTFLVDENPHNVFLQLTEHGYGIAHVTQREIRAEYWFSRIRSLQSEETLGQTLILREGEDRWMEETPAN